KQLIRIESYKPAINLLKRETRRKIRALRNYPIRPHNPKVVGSNPTPATNNFKHFHTTPLNPPSEWSFCPCFCPCPVADTQHRPAFGSPRRHCHRAHSPSVPVFSLVPWRPSQRYGRCSRRGASYSKGAFSCMKREEL